MFLLQGRDEFEKRLQHYTDQVMQYHDREKQELARAILPIAELEENTAIALAKEGKFKPSKEEFDYFFLVELLFWFKKSFRWVNAPACDFCASETNQIGMRAPSAEDLKFGASRVEIYSCQICGTCTRFPRYNDPTKLIETQCGRCGEWANCFTFYCVAMGYDARMAMDFTDHVWTECYIPYLKKWMHLDPCEASYDKPLLYEKGWGKNLNYVIGFARDGVYDVTKRYTRKWTEVLSRRNMASESDVEEVVSFLTAVQRSTMEIEEFEVLEERDRLEAEELRQSQENESISQQLPGRQSGSEKWRIARGEIGEIGCIESEKKLCGGRLCLDEHVGKIYEAIGIIISEMVDKSKWSTIQKMLLRLKECPVKSRMIDLESDPSSLYIQVMSEKGVRSLLEGVGMKVDVNEAGKAWLCMKESYVLVALALVVAIENVENVIGTISSSSSSSVDLMSEGKRLCGGVAYATGEEPPLGIASAAFDGLHSTKWEEPNGAHGAWLVYQLTENISECLIGYSLTSANDCPERDPLDWILEGSNDDGKKWQLLDCRKGEFFEERFQRKCFRISSDSQIHCNVVRFHFSAVSNATATSRLQVACIDFFVKK